MKHLLGMADPAWRRQVATPVIMNTDELINGHTLVAGMSGTGKSYQIRDLLNSCARDGIVTDVFDVHEELDGTRSSAACKFSGATQLGYNPLELSLDIHSGGVWRQIDLLVDLLNRTSRKLGPRQESALRNLLLEVYQLRGIYPNNAQSWARESIDEATYAGLTADRQWSALRRYYPTLSDVLSYGQRKVKALSLGSDNRALAALERVESTVGRINTAKTKREKAVTQAEVDTLEKQLQNDKDKALEAYSEFLNNLVTGRELTDATKYQNADTLIAVLERFEALNNCGIFRANKPDFGDALIRVFQIGALTDEQRRMLVFTRLHHILREAMDAGKCDRVRRLVVVDEGHLYYSEDGDNPINRIAKEGRKFGLALVIGSQSPTHFSEDFLTNCGAVILTGLHEKYWDAAARGMRCSKDVLEQIRAKQIIALKLHHAGAAGASFQIVNVDRDVVRQGVSRMRQQQAVV